MPFSGRALIEIAACQRYQAAMKNISRSVRQAVILITLAAVLGFVTGCRNTAEGVGRDVERAGEAIQDKVD